MSDYLTREQVEELISENRYTFTGKKYQSRCFSGEYPNSPLLPALALPGGDIGDLVVLLSASLTYGFDCDMEKAVKVLQKVVGTSSDSTYKQTIGHTAEQCRYLHFLSENPEIFSLKSENLTDFLHIIQKHELLPQISNYKAPKVKEKALIIYESAEGLYPQYIFDTITTKFTATVLIFHKTLVDARRKVFAKQLVESKAVALYDNLNEDYLFEVLSDIGDTHLFETTLKIDPSIPVFSAMISDTGKIKIEPAS